MVNEKIKKSFKGLLPKKGGKVAITDANPLWRFIAFFIDYVIIKYTLTLVFWILLISDIVPPGMFYYFSMFRTNIYEYISYFSSFQDLLLHIIFSSVLIGYFTIIESKRVWGTSIGKRVFGLKIVNKRGDFLDLKTSFLRNITKELLRLPILGIIFGPLEFILVLVNNRRTGDYLTDSIVAESVYYREGEKND